MKLNGYDELPLKGRDKNGRTAALRAFGSAVVKQLDLFCATGQQGI
jgi:hypothetical protein